MDDHVILQWRSIHMKCKQQQINWDDHRRMYKSTGMIHRCTPSICLKYKCNKSTGMITEGCTNWPGWFTEVQIDCDNQSEKGLLRQSKVSTIACSCHISWRDKLSNHCSSHLDAHVSLRRQYPMNSDDRNSRNSEFIMMHSLVAAGTQQVHLAWPNKKTMHE